jgi:Nucleotidyl transferase AbiEii toxin, Type IV TA system
VVRLEENIAEKISRLGRTTTARDMYDLTWLVTHPRDIGDLETDLIRRNVARRSGSTPMASPQAACAGEPATNHARSIRTIGYEPVRQRKSTSRTSVP